MDKNLLRIYTKLVETSRTDNYSTTNPENCQFLEIRGIRGRSVIGVSGRYNKEDFIKTTGKL